MTRNTILTALCFLLASCEKFEYNVYETNKTEKIVEASTEYNINRLLNLGYKDTLRLVFTGDTQRFYDDVEDMVEKINEMGQVDAVVIAGDLTDFGAAREFEFLNRQLIKLKAPFVTVIGNHDCLANGRELYQEIYGPLNYSFTWNRIRFVVHDTNGREYGFNGAIPDLSWMSQQLSDVGNYRGVIFVSHVPPYSEDFDDALEADYVSLIRNTSKTIFNSNGHRHNYELSQPYHDEVWYLNTSSPANRLFSYVTIYMHAGKDRITFDCTPVYF